MRVIGCPQAARNGRVLLSQNVASRWRHRHLLRLVMLNQQEIASKQKIRRMPVRICHLGASFHLIFIRGHT